MTPQEFLQKAEQIAQNTATAFKNRKPIDTHIPNHFIISYEEFEQKYGANLYLENAGFDVLVFDGDLNLNGNLNYRWLNEQFEQLGSTNDRRAMFVNGNLTIDGDILDNDEDNYLFLQVAGDVYCYYVYSENGNIVIQGNLTALLGTAGEYNDGMLSVDGTTTAPYIVSNDHSMDYISQIDYIFIDNGRIGEEYYGGLQGWDYFEDNEFMLKDGIWENEYQVNLAVFFDYIKKGENPLLSVDEYESKKAKWEEDNAEEIAAEKHQNENTAQQWEKYHNSKVVKRLYIYDYFVGSDDEFFDYMAKEYEFLSQITDEKERFPEYDAYNRVWRFYENLERILDNWWVVEQYAPAEQAEILRKIIIKAYTDDMADYILKTGDMSEIEYLYNILNDKVLKLEKDESYFYVALIKLGLALEKYEDIYPLLLTFEKQAELLPEYAESVAEFFNNDGYQEWKKGQ